MDNIVTIGSNSVSGDTQSAPQVPVPAEGGLQVTPSAVKRIRVILAKEGISTEVGGMRLGVKGGGCSGMSYAIQFEAAPRERDNAW